jgi:hypothetical protein
MKKIYTSLFSFTAGVVDTADKREHLRGFSKKFEMVLIGYSGVLEKLIHENNVKLKISCQTPFNEVPACVFHHFLYQNGRFSSGSISGFSENFNSCSLTGANVFCFLSSLPLHPPGTTAVFGSYSYSYLSSLYS